MAGTTTAFVLVGPHSTGPFGDRTWRPRHSAALIEKHRPCWVPAPVAHGAGDDDCGPAVYLPSGWSAAQELVAVVAARCIRDAGYLTLLAGYGAPHLVVPDDRPETVLPAELADAAAAVVADTARLGIVRLDPGAWLGDADLLWLRAAGIDVDDFRLNPVPGSQSDL